MFVGGFDRDLFLQWISDSQAKTVNSTFTEASFLFEDEQVHIRPFLTAGVTIGFWIEYENPSMIGSTSVEGGFLFEQALGSWVAILATGHKLSAETIEGALAAMLAENFQVNLAEASEMKLKHRGSRRNTAMELLERTLPKMHHQLLEGLPNLFFEDPQMQGTEDIIASLSGYSDFNDSHSSLYLSVRQKLERLTSWYSDPSMSDLVLIIRLETGAYVQFHQIEDHDYLYAESQSRAYKEQGNLPVSEFHEAAVNALGWNNNMLIPNEFGLFELKNQGQLAALALHVVRTLMVVHEWDGTSQVSMELFHSAQMWKETTIFHPFGTLEDAEGDEDESEDDEIDIFEEDDEEEDDEGEEGEE